MDYLDKLNSLPTVSEALTFPYNEYTKHATGMLAFRDYCLDGSAAAIDKVQEWCVHLDCVNPGGACTPSPPFPTWAVTASNASAFTTTTPNVLHESYANTTPIIQFIRSVGFNESNCYDNYLCDHEGLSSANHWVLGFGCLLLCLVGIASNLVLLPAYNLGLNRSGATLFLTSMAILDLVYLVLTLLVVVSHYLPSGFEGQMIYYTQFSARFVPIGVPVMHLCEFVVVWLVVALLANRLLFLKLGFQSKLLCSQLQAFKSIAALVVFGLAYCSCKFIEYTVVEYEKANVMRVVLTPVGKSSLYRNLMYSWLNVPLQMFLPYLSVGILVSVVVTKMLDFHHSKWKAVASLCNDTACACVCRTGVCGTECKEGGGIESPIEPRSPLPDSAKVLLDQPKASDYLIGSNSPGSKKASAEFVDPIEEELAYLFFQLPRVDETREHANVITSVCIGLLLVMLKVPKFLLHVLSTENYIDYDPAVFTMIDQFLDTVFAACKPCVCILVGAHFRRVLLEPSQCASADSQAVTTEVHGQGDVQLQRLSFADHAV